MEYFETAASLQNHDQLTQCCATFAPRRLTEGLSRTWCLPAPTKIAMHVVIKSVKVYQLARFVIQKILVPLLPANVLNIELESAKLSCHPLQYINDQIVPLLLINLAPFARILSTPVMLSLLSIT